MYNQILTPIEVILTMSVNLQIRKVIGFLALSAGCSDFLSAQDVLESKNLGIAKRCAAAAAKASNQLALSSKERIMEFHRCEVTGPDVLARTWESPPSGAEALNALYMVSATAADKRVYKRLMQIAADPRRPFNDRAGALGTLASYLNPSFRAAMIQDPAAPGGNRITIAMLSHPEGASGSQPLSDIDRTAISALCKRLSETDTVEDIRWIAQRILKIPTVP